MSIDHHLITLMIDFYQHEKHSAHENAMRAFDAYVHSLDR
jgi:hypothetical protein